MKLSHYLLVAPLLLAACHKDTTSPIIDPGPVPVPYTDSFSGTYSYTCHMDNSSFMFDTTFTMPLKVYVYHYVTVDSIRIYDSLGDHAYSFTPTLFDNEVGHYQGIWSVAAKVSDSGRYRSGNFYIRMSGDSLLYSNAPSLIQYRGGGSAIDTVTETFKGKR